MAGVRHLTDSQAKGAVGRNHQIDQLLGISELPDGRRAVRWLSIYVLDGRFVLTLHATEDVGDDDFCDVAEFPPLDEDEDRGEGRRLATSADLEVVFEISTVHGAHPDRWVNFGVLGAEYLDARHAAS